MSKKTLALIIVLFLITVGLLVLAFAPVNKNATIAPSIPVPNVSQAPLVYPQVMLRLSPSPLVIASQSGTLTVGIDSGSNKVTAVQIELSYDKTVITNIDVTPGTFFANPLTLLKNIDTNLGRISYVLATTPGGKAVTGKGTVATLTFTTNLVTGGKTAITFTPKTLVTAEGLQTTALKTTENTTIYYIQQGVVSTDSAKPVQ